MPVFGHGCAGGEGGRCKGKAGEACEGFEAGLHEWLRWGGGSFGKRRSVGPFSGGIGVFGLRVGWLQSIRARLAVAIERPVMIARYSRPDMVAIWSPEAKFKIWFEIEAHACDAQAALGVIPMANAAAVWRARDVTFDVARIDEIEAVTKHDVIAFLTH